MRRLLPLIPWFVALPVCAQDAPDTSASERWNVFYQATSIGQYHPSFNAPYRGANSLESYPERDVSLTSTIFSIFRVTDNTQLVFDPELAGGRGFSAVTGLANPTNGELPRVAAATPKPYLARLYLIHDFALGSDREGVEGSPNQLGGSRPMTRYTVVVGRFTLTDFFDNNRYAHDPRGQFMGWANMADGAWDYPADTRGYTWGWMHELHARHWSVRYASAAEPTVANGSRFDRRLFRDRGDVVEGEARYKATGRPGAVRLLLYQNRTRSGSYAEALRVAAAQNTTPDVASVRRQGTLKYGLGLNAEQELAKDVGVFMRLGWSDGKNEDFAFTAIDRLASAGVSVGGGRWRRPDDVAASSFTAAGISGVHALYLSRGGLDFLIGDGRLNYAPEYMWESYYSARVVKGFMATLDAQRIYNPAYNHDRGPVWAFSLRLHLEGAFRR